MLYTDDSLLIGKNDDIINSAIQELKDQELQLTEEGTLEDFLGVNIQKLNDTTYHLHQQHQIAGILKDLRLDSTSNSKEVPMKTSTILAQDINGDPHDNSFDYRSVIGKLSHVERCTRLDLAYAVHQCARFASSPRQSHAQAVRWIGRYLLNSADKGYVINIDDTQGLQLFVDSDWVGLWNRKEAPKDVNTAKSRYGFIITFYGVPILWASRLQTLIALSSTEAEYIGLSEAVREVIPLIHVLDELRYAGFHLPVMQTQVKCKVFEDNSGAIELATKTKVRPHTKHINVKYHHFRQLVLDGIITVQYIPSEDNPADILTKPVPKAHLTKHLQSLLKWHVVQDLRRGVTM